MRAGSVTSLLDNAYDLKLADTNGDGRLDLVIVGAGGLRTYLTEPSF